MSRPRIPEFTTAAEGALHIQAYFRQVLHDVHQRELLYALFQSENYLRMVEEKEEFDPTKLHFSEVSGECPRLPLLSVMNAESNERQINSFMKSGELHEMLLLGVLEYGHPNEFEYQYTPASIPEGTQAHMDVIWRERRVVMELKSAGVGAKDVNKFPMPSHQLQLGGYVHFTEEDERQVAEVLGRDFVPWMGVLIYTFRDAVLEVDAFPLPEHCKQEMALRIDEAVTRLKNNSLPSIPKHFDPEKYPCIWHMKGGRTSKCKHYAYCWGDRQPEQEKAKPLSNNEAQKIADNLAQLLLKKQQLKEKAKEVEEDIDLEQEKLRNEFESAVKSVVYTNHPDYNIKEVVTEARDDYDLRELLRRGLIDQSLLEMVKKRTLPSRYVRFVKKRGD